MHYLLCKHKVADFASWYKVFKSHAEAQQNAGLHLLHLLRNTTDPNYIVLLFRVEDPAKARAFTEAPSAREAAQTSGVIGQPEVLILSE
jgi:hypothetical protein